MLIKTGGAARNILIFTKETCERMQAMEVGERKQKLAGVLTAFFQNRLPQPIGPAADIAKEFGVDEELIGKVLSYMSQKGLTGPSDAGDVMNRQAPVAAGVFFTGVVDPLLDFGFEEIFDFIDMRQSMQTQFDIIDVSNLITFSEKKSGERMKKYGITTGKATIVKMVIAAAIGIEDDWIKYAMYWNLNQAAIEARSKYYDKMATDHYALLAAISAGQNQAFATDDITTINNACALILTDCSALGFTITGNEQFILRAHINLKQRIEKAFSLTFNSPNTDKNQLVYSLNRMYTTKIAATSYYVGLSGRKAKRGIWSDLSAETDRDILLKGTDVAYCGEYNAGIGQEKQFRRLALT